MDNIDYETFKQIKEVIDNKINLLYKELKSNSIIQSNSLEKIKKIIINLKNNFINLNNHEKKIFLERFVKFIEVEKVNDTVIIKNVEF